MWRCRGQATAPHAAPDLPSIRLSPEEQAAETPRERDRSRSSRRSRIAEARESQEQAAASPVPMEGIPEEPDAPDNLNMHETTDSRAILADEDVVMDAQGSPSRLNKQATEFVPASQGTAVRTLHLDQALQDPDSVSMGGG